MPILVPAFTIVVASACRSMRTFSTIAATNGGMDRPAEEPAIKRQAEKVIGFGENAIPKRPAVASVAANVATARPPKRSVASAAKRSAKQFPAKSAELITPDMLSDNPRSSLIDGMN